MTPLKTIRRTLVSGWLHKVKNKYTIYIQCRKIYNLSVGALETGINVSLWRVFLACFIASAN
jgi:hypothetical protein